ncbi:Hypothetical predicted protein [Olea europaea subsp. europaea]|uniref:Smr domain-containing protein n=1 Tax=Olea europaea subsp. europaea TaxID=158383 RepID=A0A8S0SCC4_OLEEU|nr:Hypothetical predicted protein [Olea europaea subsp. europaea]
MSFSGKVASAVDKKLTAAKAISLNPNAAEFIPFSLRSSAGGTSVDEVSKYATPSGSTPGKAVLDRSESSVPNDSDEEAHQYWDHQLPDDITPDFKVMGGDDTQGINGLSFSSLSLNDISESSRFSASTGSGFISKDTQELSPHPRNNNNYAEKLRFPISYSEYPSPTGFQHSLPQPWDKQIVNDDLLLGNVHEGPQYNGNSIHAFLSDMSNEQILLDNTDANPIDFLASQFRGFAAESLAEVYFASGGDLNLTIEMLTQLELQVDGGFNQNPNSQALSTPNLSALDFPALSGADGQNGLPKFAGDDLQQNSSPYQSPEKESALLFRSSSSIASRDAIDFASAVRKMPPQESSIWKYSTNGSSIASIGSSRSSQVPISSYNSGQGRSIYGDRLQNRGSARLAPTWLETGEAVANMYSELREEARDHARLRNACFEQARQAYLIGNKALAKELSIKGQLHNMQMKAAHGKAQESIYRQRNPEMQGNGREKMIDLHGLHASEAIHVLKRELSVMRNAARLANQHLLVYICVGTGHHTRGSRTPARLPTAVQRYLLEEEGLEFSEPQPGLLQVVVY